MSTLNTKVITTGTLGLAGLVATGLIAFTAPSALAEEGPDRSDVVLKRDDDTADVVTTVDDDDDDDTGNTNTNTGTGDSRSRADNTNSRVTAVSRDRDRSRGDLTKDFTRDGGDRTRDWSKNSTNDKSRNDTRR
ncbi:hypothetical protein [Nocardioides ferulae]|uniref:hypothetical protein n=1 Tax=Nocardioides ferulae TaxID=2340821 RepID=UPI000EAE795B|nr:hypothetical protein [Nocardioides ferulae]